MKLYYFSVTLLSSWGVMMAYTKARLHTQLSIALSRPLNLPAPAPSSVSALDSAPTLVSTLPPATLPPAAPHTVSLRPVPDRMASSRKIPSVSAMGARRHSSAFRLAFRVSCKIKESYKRGTM